MIIQIIPHWFKDHNPGEAEVSAPLHAQKYSAS